MIIEGRRLPVLENSIHSLCNEINKANPDTKLYVFGSLGRRFALVGDNITLEEYIKAAKNNNRLMPRKNYRGNTDIDIGISENEIPWAEYSSIAKKISENNPGVEIDPHVLSVSENGIEVKGPASKEFPIKKRPQNLEIKTGTITVNNEQMKMHPFSLQTQLKLMEICGRPQYKNFLEAAYIISRQKNIDIMSAYPEVAWIFLKYYSLIDWKAMSATDTAKLIWRSTTSHKFQHELAKIRGKTEEIYNYNDTEPVYL